MSRKDFDAKQFLLEKGERVGLGVAVTLMVLMLILSLFMPGKGFFSGSPAAKAKELRKITEDLENKLVTAVPGPNDKPAERGEGKLIALDTKGLNADNYATAMWFEPRLQENKSRRPPEIYNVEEAVAEVAKVPIDTYLFRWKSDPPRICVLEDKDRGTPIGGGGAAAGGMMNNPFSRLRPGGGSMPSMPGGGPGGPMMGRNPFGGNLNAPGSLIGVGDKPEYGINWISVEEWNPQQLTAHQLQPLRMAIIAGSFPYKKQLEEHKTKLRLDSIDQVLEETVGEGDKKSSAFYFRGVEVERKEVDADGKTIHDWAPLNLKESYKVWLENSYYPPEPEDPKYDQVRANDGIGLVMPRLRAFDARKVTTPGLPGMMPGMGGLGSLGGTQRRQESPPDEPKSKYPDVAAKLPKIQETLDKLREAKPKAIASSKFRKAELGDTFNPNVVPPSEDANKSTQQGGTKNGDSYIPDYVLARVVDITIQPGKHYKYRLKVKMTNPNYQRKDVASPEYKEKETLESKDWYELPQTVTVPPETFYYVVDELQGLGARDLAALRVLRNQSAQARLLDPNRRPDHHQVVFQFHRWVEQTRPDRREDAIPVGEWAVADRVIVSRGEYVGRTVNVDLPIWKFNQNAFILPVEDQSQRGRSNRRATTGIDVDFGQDPPENNLILVDFEGGRGLQLPNSKIKDDCAVEVLMLSPDGKLLARNSVKDTADKERIDRRNEVLKRIQDVREGKGTE